MDGWVQSKLLTSHTSGHLLLEGGVSKCLYKLAGILFYAGVGDLQSKSQACSFSLQKQK